ncbi:MAG: AsmA-like C-terminal region-containing protein, partial [Planctomycetes bacterium]|nr:AsmA-like C-terminal region-containing protein [Planctomycetota bacterium]
QGTASGRAAVLVGYDIGGDFELDGRLDGLGGAGPLEVHGTGRLSGWNVHGGDAAVAESFTVNVRAFGRSIDIGGVHGRLLEGQAFGAFRVDLPAGEPTRTQGWMTVDDLSLERLAAALGRTDVDVAGRLDVGYRFTADAPAASALRGGGGLSVRDSRMLGVPVLTAVLGAVRARSEAASDTDVELAFTNVGDRVTLTGGRLATPIVAISPLPGGTVRLATGELDVHVVAALLADISQYLDFPVLDLIVPFTQQATQLHITGTWESRESVTIAKEPLRDLGEATVRFFKGAVETGGELTESFTEPARAIAPW